eukprot:c37289_g1_i1 orf=124-318(+)
MRVRMLIDSSWSPSRTLLEGSAYSPPEARRSKIAEKEAPAMNMAEKRSPTARRNLIEENAGQKV